MSTISQYITYIGYGVLTYKTVKSLSISNAKQQQDQPIEELSSEEKERLDDQLLHVDILKQWIIFITFLVLEPFIFEISELIPFSLGFFIVVKVLIIYPHFLIHLYLYELLQKLELDNYAENKIFVYASTILKEIILFSLDLIADAVKYVNLTEIPEIQTKMQRINEKIGFKQEVCEKKKDLLTRIKEIPQAFSSSIEFSKWSRKSMF